MSSKLSKIKDPGSAITHFIAMALAIIAAVPLLMKAAREPDHIHVVALAIFIVSMILLYAASTTYHTLDITPKITTILRKIDHMMIFVLIAGSYTPICLLVLDQRTGILLLSLLILKQRRISPTWAAARGSWRCPHRWEYNRSSPRRCTADRPPDQNSRCR